MIYLQLFRSIDSIDSIIDKINIKLTAFAFIYELIATNFATIQHLYINNNFVNINYVHSIKVSSISRV